ERLAGMLDHRAAPAAPRARLADREEALALTDDAAPAALRARDRSRAGVGARAAARLARPLLRHRDRYLGPGHRLVERDLDLRFEIAPARRLLLGTAPAEEAREDVSEVRGEAAAPAEAAPATEAREHPAGVVLLALLGIGQRVVGLLDLLEPLLRGVVAGVPIRVVLAGELGVGPLDLVGRRLPVDPEALVEVARHCRLTSACG